MIAPYSVVHVKKKKNITRLRGGTESTKGAPTRPAANGQQVVRYQIDGVKHRQIIHAGHYQTQIMVNGQWRTQYTVELPRTPDNGGFRVDPNQCECSQCHGVYPSMMMPNGVCFGCRAENAAERAKRFEDAGIPMGWGGVRHEHDHNWIDPAWSYSEAHQRNKGEKFEEPDENALPWAVWGYIGQAITRVVKQCPAVRLCKATFMDHWPAPSIAVDISGWDVITSDDAVRGHIEDRIWQRAEEIRGQWESSLARFLNDYHREREYTRGDKYVVGTQEEADTATAEGKDVVILNGLRKPIVVRRGEILRPRLSTNTYNEGSGRLLIEQSIKFNWKTPPALQELDGYTP